MTNYVDTDSSTGNSGYIDLNQRKHTRSFITPENEEATKIGNSYNLNTGIITLTNDVLTPIAYLKNNSSSSFHIKTFVMKTWTSTGGDADPVGEPYYYVYRNPVEGTIVTNATEFEIPPSNRNYGSPKTALMDAYKGATGNTLTTTEAMKHIFVAKNLTGREAVSIDELLPTGTSIGIKYKPPTNNTSQKLYFAIIGHYEDPKDKNK